MKTGARTTHRLRTILRRATEPVSTTDLGVRLGMTTSAVANALHRMPDAYIEGWDGRRALWRVTKTPPHAPKP